MVACSLLSSCADEGEAFDREWRHRTGAGRHGRVTQGLPQAGGGAYRALPPTPMDRAQPRNDPSTSQPTVSPIKHKKRERAASLSAEESEACRRYKEEGKHLHFNVRPQCSGSNPERKAKGRKEPHRYR